jgi:hypothetical protein
MIYRRLLVLMLIIPWSVVFLGLSIFYKVMGR